jgi:regulatory protein
MVRFTPAEDDGEHLATVSYLPSAREGRGSKSANGKEISSGELSEPGPKSHESGSRASRVAVHQLARRGMSRWELEQVLAKRGVDAVLAASELDRLESVGLLDDAALAVTLVFTLHTRRGLGRTAIAQELARRHIESEIVADALSEIEDDDERERALELAMKRVGQLATYDDATATRRLTGFLARKGYDSQVVRNAVAEAMKTRSSRVRFS